MSKRKDPNLYPPGLNRKKVEQIIAYYDARQGIDLAEDPDHQFVHEPTGWIEVPLKLVPQVRKLVAKYRKSA